VANPQLENGHTNIANEILEALWKVNLSSYETRVLIYLLRKTYGWHKKTDRISLSQFSREIGMDRRLVHRTLKELSSKGMIVVIPQDDRKPVSYGFQKDYQKWNLSSPKMTHHKSVIPLDDSLSSPEMTKLSSPEIPTKETTKETIQKKTNVDDSDESRLSKLLFSLIKERDPKLKEPNWANWNKDIRLLIKEDKRTTEEAEEIIKWSQIDEFWQNNILSPKKLRKQFTQLKLKMNKSKESPYGIYDHGKKIL